MKFVTVKVYPAMPYEVLRTLLVAMSTKLTMPAKDFECALEVIHDDHLIDLTLAREYFDKSVSINEEKIDIDSRSVDGND